MVNHRDRPRPGTAASALGLTCHVIASTVFAADRGSENQAGRNRRRAMPGYAVEAVTPGGGTDSGSALIVCVPAFAGQGFDGSVEPMAIGASDHGAFDKPIG